MRMRICAVLLIAVTVSLWGQTPAPAVTFAQTGLAGTWRAESPTPVGIPWTTVLRVDGSRVGGAVSSCASVQGAFEIFDGKSDGNTITFKCMSGDRQRTVTLTGRIDGDEIDFTWEIQGPGAPPNQMFGTAAPPRFTAKRVPDVAGAVTNMADRFRKAVTFDRILHAEQEPQNWLTYSGSVRGLRYSPLTQLTPSNVKDLELAWFSQTSTTGSLEATPLVVDGVMYTTRNTNDVVALDASTGRVIWVYPYTPMQGARATGGGGRPNRGLAILGHTLFLGTLDAHLLAIDALSGKLTWDTTIADARDPACQGGPCYVITLAPLIVKNKVIVGVGGGEGRTRGFVAAFEADSGKEAWRFYTIPAAGEPGNNTWSGDSWKLGGAPVWNTGAFDADLNLTYWGTGNPYPPYDGSTRDGDNLYSNSVVALDADTGKLKWHYQFTPHDDQDWDAAQIPVLTDLEWQGRPRKVMLWANRNGLMYVLDRSTGLFLMGKPFVEVDWMDGFDDKGRPVRVPGKVNTAGVRIMPGTSATNWYPPSYSPSTGLFYIPSWERASEGGVAVGGAGYGAVRAFDPKTGEKAWEFKLNDALFSAGVLTTASNLLFTGVAGDFYSAVPSQEAIASGVRRTTRIEPDPARLVDGYFYALDARTGQRLWRMSLAGSLTSGPMSYSVRGKQYVAVAAGNSLFAFALRQ